MSPDLILVMTDQQRFDQLGYASDGPVRTPHLDRLAAQGTTFTNAYSGSTTCVPARTSLLTGLFDHRASFPTDRYALEQGFWTVPHALRQAGYQTALIGKMHFLPIRSDHGFEHVRLCEHLGAYEQDASTMDELDHYHDWLVARGEEDWRLGPITVPYPVLGTHPTTWVRDETLRFLDERDRSRPLFLIVSFPHPHPPVNPPEPYASMYDPADCPLPEGGAQLNAALPAAFRRATGQAGDDVRRVDPDRLVHHQRELARTYGLVTQIDDAVGEIVEQLDLSEALLFFTADHGDYAGHRGLVRKIPWIPFDDLAKVPCFATGGLVEGGRTEAGLVQSFDFAVTCLDYAGIDVDLDVLDGESLRPTFSGGPVPGGSERTVCSAISMKWPMARRGPHKYIRSLGWGEEVLFDVERNPEESLNLRTLDPEILHELRAEVDRQLAAGIPDLPSFHGRRVAG